MAERYTLVLPVLVTWILEFHEDVFSLNPAIKTSSYPLLSFKYKIVGLLSLKVMTKLVKI